MRTDLRRALKDRDRPTVVALRTALAAIANAEAVPDDGSLAPTHGQLIDHPRRTLTPDDVLVIVRNQIADRRETIGQIVAHGGGTDDLAAEVDVLQRYLV